jgi:uncharacterized protein
VWAVLDPNVLISAVLAPNGNAAKLLRTWQRGEFELIVSPALIAELERALAYPKLRSRIPEDDAREFVRWLAETATLVDDPDEEPPLRSADPGDDYLIALAATRRAILVSGDRHLLALTDNIPVDSPARFLERLSPHRAS